MENDNTGNLASRIDVLRELKSLAQWVRRGEYERDDARDEIARAIENRIRQIASSDLGGNDET